MPSTRRRVLQAAAGGLAAGLAGCSALTGSGSSRRTDPPPGDPVTGYETARHEVADDRTLFRWTGESDRPTEQLLVATPDERAAVAFDTGGDDPVSALLADTDLEQAAVALLQRRHDECRRLDVSDVRRGRDRVRVQLCAPVRPADEPCDVDERHSTALAVRLPFDGRSLADGLRVAERSHCTDRYGPREEGA